MQFKIDRQRHARNTRQSTAVAMSHMPQDLVVRAASGVFIYNSMRSMK